MTTATVTRDRTYVIGRVADIAAALGAPVDPERDVCPVELDVLGGECEDLARQLGEARRARDWSRVDELTVQRDAAVARRDTLICTLLADTVIRPVLIAEAARVTPSMAVAIAHAGGVRVRRDDERC